MTTQNFPIMPGRGDDPLGLREGDDEEREQDEDTSDEPSVISLDEVEKAAQGNADDE